MDHPPENSERAYRMAEQKQNITHPPKELKDLFKLDDAPDRSDFYRFLTLEMWVVFAAVTIGGIISTKDPRHGLVIFGICIGVGTLVAFLIHSTLMYSIDSLVRRFYGFRRMNETEQQDLLRENAYDQAIWLTREHRYDDAIRLYRKIVQDYASATEIKPYFKIGEIYELYLNDPERAKKAYARVISIAHRHPQADQPLLVREAHRRLNALRQAGYNPEHERLAELIHDADECFTNQDYEGAFERYRLASQINLNSTKAIFGCVQALFHQHKMADTITWLTHAREVDPSEPRVERLFAQVYESLEAREKAISSWQACIEKADMNDIALITQAKQAIERLQREMGIFVPVEDDRAIPLSFVENTQDRASAILSSRISETSDLFASFSETEGIPLSRMDEEKPKNANHETLVVHPSQEDSPTLPTESEKTSMDLMTENDEPLPLQELLKAELPSEVNQAVTQEKEGPLKSEAYPEPEPLAELLSEKK